MPNKKVILSVTNDLVNEQRVHKVALSLINNGFNVLMIGRKLPNSKKIKRQYKTKRFKLLFNKGPLFYICFNIRLFIFLLFSKFDILNSNDLDTLPANFLISKIKNKKIIYDSHEYFTEVPELIHRKNIRKIWLLIEKLIIPKIKYAYTVSPTIANIYKQKYNTNFKLIMNLPIKQHITNTQKKYDIIYQGALNIGRGLEILLYAISQIPDINAIIIGDGNIKTELENLAKHLNIDDRVKFTGKIDFKKLFNLTQQAEIGVSLEQETGLNYKYALPNKLFDYINAEIPAIISPLPEMKKINDKYNIAYTLHKTDVKHLIQAILTLLNNNELYTNIKTNTKKAKQYLNWEHNEKTLLEMYK